MGEGLFELAVDAEPFEGGGEVAGGPGGQSCTTVGLASTDARPTGFRLCRYCWVLNHMKATEKDSSPARAHDSRLNLGGCTFPDGFRKVIVTSRPSISIDGDASGNKRPIGSGGDGLIRPIINHSANFDRQVDLVRAASTSTYANDSASRTDRRHLGEPVTIGGLLR